MRAGDVENLYCTTKLAARCLAQNLHAKFPRSEWFGIGNMMNLQTAVAATLHEQGWKLMHVPNRGKAEEADKVR